MIVMRFHRVFVGLLLIAVTFVLPFLAQASPPDQTWIGGLSDNADYDDAVLTVTSTSAAADTHLCLSLEPTRIVVGSLSAPPQQSPPAREATPQRPRAPPAA